MTTSFVTHSSLRANSSRPERHLFAPALRFPSIAKQYLNIAQRSLVQALVVIKDRYPNKEKIMNRLIEADFFPRDLEAAREKPCILIIDNDRDFTHFTKLALEKTGNYSVCEENDASKAHQTAQRVKPDLILLDIVMPETDGGEVAARIQSNPRLQGTPIIFLTALVTKAETRSGLRIQGHPFLAKPITFPELIRGIEENLPACSAC